jgi:hypothetical protein
MAIVRRPDQRLVGTSIAGAGPAPSNVLFARVVIVSGTNEGVFVYDGTPGLGNPPVNSDSDTSKDPFGNTVLPGQVTYTWGTSPPYALQNNGGSLTFYYWNGSEFIEQAALAFAGDVGTPDVSITLTVLGNNAVQISDYAFTLFGKLAFLTPSGDASGVTDLANLRLAAANGPGTTISCMGGLFQTDSTFQIPPWVTLMGQGTVLNNSFLSDNPTTIQPVAGFSSSAAKNAVLLCVDEATGDYSIPSAGQQVININVDGSIGPAALDGIDLYGSVNGFLWRDNCISAMTNAGFQAIVNGSGIPDGLRMNGGLISDCGSNGFFFQVADCICWDLHPSNNGLDGFRIITAANSIFNSCRSASNFNRGWNFGAASGSASPTGFIVLNGCNSQLNIWDGMYVDWPVNGGQQIICNSFVSLGDGINTGSGGGGFGGVTIASAVAPIDFDNLVVIPQVSTTSPEYGLQYANCSSLNVVSGSVNAWTAAYKNNGGNGQINIAPYVNFFTGSPLAPVASLYNEWNYVGAAGQPGFGAGWANTGAGNADLGFALDGQNRLRIRGYVTNSVAGNTANIFVLPVGYRPASQQIFPMVENGTVYGNSIVIQTNGDVTPFGAAGGGNYDINCDVSLSI